MWYSTWQLGSGPFSFFTGKKLPFDEKKNTANAS